MNTANSVQPAFKSTLATSSQDWPVVAFGDVVRNVAETCREPEAEGLERYLGLEHFDSENLHIKRWGLLAEDEVSFTRRFRAGQVLFGKRRAYLKKVAVAEFDGICSSDILCFEPKDPKVLLPGVLPFIVQSDGFFAHALGTSSGSLSPRTRWSQLKDYRFPLPPVDEQRRIAQLLWAADEVVERWRLARDDMEALRTSCLFELYEHGIFRDADLIETPMGPRPSTWDIVPLAERYEIQLGKMMSKKARNGNAQRPYIRNANVQWNRLELDDVATMSFNDREAEKFALRRGDILACEGRHVGKSAIWNGEIEGACYQKALHRLRRKHDTDSPEYMLFHMDYSSRKGAFADNTVETTIPHLPAEKLRKIYFSFPPPDEQTAIADRIMAIDSAVKDIDQTIHGARQIADTYFEEQFGGTP